MGITEERVRIVVENIVKGANKIVGFRNTLRGVGRDVNAAGALVNKNNQQFASQGAVVSELSHKFNSFRGVMGMNMDTWKQVNTQGVRFNNVGARMGNTFRMATHGMRGFRMEMLGVMFFGMMLQRTMTQLVRPAAEAFGVFDLWREMLTILFLPIMELLFPFFLSMVEFFINLPPGVKLAIGVFVGLVAVLGILLFIIGTLMLGLGSVALMFSGPLVGAFSAIIGVVGAVIAVIAGIALIVGGVYMIVKGKMEGIGLVIMGVGLILLLFIGWWALIPIAVGAAVYLIIKHWDKVASFFKGLWTSIKTGFNSLINWAKDWAVKFAKAIWDFLPGWLKKILDFGFKANVAVGNWIGGLFKGSKDDFVWRAGEGAVSINPNDTLVGFKGESPVGGGSYNPTYNISVVDNNALRRLLEEHDRSLLERIRRNVA